MPRVRDDRMVNTLCAPHLIREDACHYAGDGIAVTEGNQHWGCTVAQHFPCGAVGRRGGIVGAGPDETRPRPPTHLVRLLGELPRISRANRLGPPATATPLRQTPNPDLGRA